MNSKNKPKEEKTVPLTSPTIGEKVALLKSGSDSAAKLNLHVSLQSMIEGMRNTLLPLVQWLDQKITKVYQLDHGNLSEHFKRMRVMLVFSGSGEGSFRLGLHREGMWFVQTAENSSLVDSEELTSIIAEKGGFLVKSSLGLSFYQGMSEFLGQHLTIYELARYHGIVWFFAQCHETVKKLLQEREERMRIMKERLSLFEDFSRSLDPLLAQNRTVRVPRCSIFRKKGNRPGDSRYTGAYFSPDVLAPVWEDINRGKYGDKTLFFSLDETWVLPSLQRLFWHLGSEIGDISRPRGSHESTDLLGHRRQIPFTEQERTVLLELIASIGKPE